MSLSQRPPREIVAVGIEACTRLIALCEPLETGHAEIQQICIEVRQVSSEFANIQRSLLDLDGRPAAEGTHPYTDILVACAPLIDGLIIAIPDVQEALKDKSQTSSPMVNLAQQIEDTSRVIRPLMGLIAQNLLSVAHPAPTKQQLQYEPDDEVNTQELWHKLAASDPYNDHESARQKFEPGTNTWLLESTVYAEWRTGALKHLWLFGQAGCGKTILCSSVIEDIKTRYGSDEDIACVFFYFSFSDAKKQTYRDLLRAMIVQLAQGKTGNQIYQRFCNDLDQGKVEDTGLETLASLLIESYRTVILIVDALDEGQWDAARPVDTLGNLGSLAQSHPNLQMFSTSRDTMGVRVAMEAIRAQAVAVSPSLVTRDIERYVSSQLTRNARLSRFDSALKALIEKVVSEKADGM